MKESIKLRPSFTSLRTEADQLTARLKADAGRLRKSEERRIKHILIQMVGVQRMLSHDGRMLSCTMNGPSSKMRTRAILSFGRSHLPTPPSTIVIKSERLGSNAKPSGKILLLIIRKVRFQDEVLKLPLAGVEAIISSDDLQVGSEDIVYDFVLKWARSRYPNIEDRRQILRARLSKYIRFSYMTCRKLRRVMTCPDFDQDLAQKVVIEALFFKADAPHKQRTYIGDENFNINHRFSERAYKYCPLKVVEFEHPRPQCVVYLDLKHEECASLYPSGRVYSQAFHLGGQGFFLSAHCNMDHQTLFHCFGLFLGMQEKGPVSLAVDYEFAARSKPTEEFVSKYTGTYIFTGGKAVGYRNLFAIPWSTFIGDDSVYFLNGLVHLRAELTVRNRN
ncbi:hypothetical protein R6Q57_014688 [Mikania cordata]